MSNRGSPKIDSGKRRVLKVPNYKVATNKKNSSTQDLAKHKEQLDQFSNYVVNMIDRRVHNLKYLEQVYHGSVLWLNTVRFSAEAIQNSNFRKKLVARNFYNLGMSLAWAQQSDGRLYIRAISTVFEEYKFYTQASSSVRNAEIKRSAQTVNPVDEKTSYTTDVQVVNGVPHYKYFESIAIPFAIDFYEAVLTLLNVMANMYEKLRNCAEQNLHLLNACITIDKRVTSLILEYLINDLQKIAKVIIQNSLLNFQPVANTEHSAYIRDDDEDDEDDYKFGEEEDENFSIDEIVEKLVGLNSQVEQERESFAYRNHECQVVSKAIRGASRQLTAQACMIALLEEQVRVHQNTTVSSDEEEAMKNNFILLENTLNETIKEREKMSSNIAVLQKRLQVATQARDSEKPEFMQLLKRVRKLETQREHLKEASA